MQMHTKSCRKTHQLTAAQHRVIQKHADSQRVTDHNTESYRNTQIHRESQRNTEKHREIFSCLLEGFLITRSAVDLIRHRLVAHPPRIVDAFRPFVPNMFCDRRNLHGSKPIGTQVLNAFPRNVIPFPLKQVHHGVALAVQGVGPQSKHT